MKLFALSALALMAWGSASVRAAPWIQQNRWMVLGPLDNPAWCWGDLPNPPAPGHDLALECPRLGDDWSGGAIPFVTGALTRWTDLDALGVGRGDVVDLESLAVNLGLPDELRDGVKALLAIYVINRTASPLEVGVCTASDDAIKVWVNDRTVVGLPACRGVTCTCSEVNPAVLIPGKNKVLVAQYEGEGGWGFRLRLLRADGTVIDDTTDPEVQFTLDPPEDCPRLGSSTVLRSVGGPVSACEAGPDARSLITLRGSGGGNPDDQVAVTEHLDGQAAPSEISDGGVYTPQVPPLPCGTAPLGPVGIFRDHRDIGRPCAAGSTATSAPGAYTVTGGGCDIWANCDQFQYAYTHLRGDFSIRARIAKRPWDEPGGLSPNRWGKFGLMVRQDCSDESRCAFIHDSSPTPDGGDLDQVRFLGRPTQGGDDVFDTGLGPAGLHPSHLRLDRVGSRFIGYASPDGAAWTELHSMDWGPSAPCEVLVGLARLLGGDGEHAVEGRSVIDFNAARPEPVGPHFENAQDIYPFFLNRGSTSFDPQSGLYTVESSGLDIWDGGDSFHFAYRRVAGDFDFTVLITERIDPPVPDSRWGKHGLMARKDCSQLSKYSLVRRGAGRSTIGRPMLSGRSTGSTPFLTKSPASTMAPTSGPAS